MCIRDRCVCVCVCVCVSCTVIICVTQISINRTSHVRLAHRTMNAADTKLQTRLQHQVGFTPAAAKNQPAATCLTSHTRHRWMGNARTWDSVLTSTGDVNNDKFCTIPKRSDKGNSITNLFRWRWRPWAIPVACLVRREGCSSRNAYVRALDSSCFDFFLLLVPQLLLLKDELNCLLSESQSTGG